MAETVLVVGASGNIGVSAVIGARRSNLNVLAVVRNKESGEKLIKQVGSSDGITLVEGDITKEDGVQKIVDRVKAGDLPAFQHVYSGIGGADMTNPISNVSTEAFRYLMNVSVEGTFFAYRATVPYLLEQGKDSTWTMITGAAGDFGSMGITAITQGALYALANVAIRETADSKIRFNEVTLSFRVDYDSVVAETGDAWRTKASDFARLYQGVLANKQIKGCRVKATSPKDIDNLDYHKKL
jgi:NAD(P)-dependent dehydrogenase (short-subunit alcohol dehydrogenase family)